VAEPAPGALGHGRRPAARQGVGARAHAPAAAPTTLDEIETRYAGREDMLVHYPIGGQSPLGKAVQLLRNGD
jgi:hypothetical protein